MLSNSSVGGISHNEVLKDLVCIVLLIVRVMTSVNYCCIVSHFSLEKKTKQSLVKQKLRSAFMLKHSPVIKIYKGIEY